MSAINKISIAGIVIGLSAMSLAQSNSLLGTMNDQSKVNNTQNSVQSAHQGTTGYSGGSTGSSSGHTSGGHTGGSTGGGHQPPGCVPEPASMLALGVGAGLVFLKKRKQA